MESSTNSFFGAGENTHSLSRRKQREHGQDAAAGPAQEEEGQLLGEGAEDSGRRGGEEGAAALPEPRGLGAREVDGEPGALGEGREERAACFYPS